MRPVALLILLLAGACATAEEASVYTTAAGPSTIRVGGSDGYFDVGFNPEDRTLRQVLPYPAATVRAALAATYQSLGIPGGVLNSAPNTYGQADLRVNGRLADTRPSSFAECGLDPVGAPIADTFTLRGSILTAVEAAGESESRVTTRLDVVATPRSGGNPSRCVSKGELERRIHAELERLLRP